MAKKKKSKSSNAPVPSSFNPAAFRRGEEASMAALPTPVAPKPEAAESPTLINLQPAGDPAKAAIQQEFTSFYNRVNEELSKSEKELTDLIAQIEAEAIDAERIADEAAKLAAQAEADVQAGDIAMQKGNELFKEEFYRDPYAKFEDLGTTTKNVVSTGLFGGNAALTAAFSALAAIGVEGLLDVMNRIRAEYPDISAEDALTLVKFDKRYNEPYLRRFEGNRKRLQAGLAPLDDKTYLANEAAYGKIFEAYGLKQFANRERYANFIGSDIAPDEVAERVQLVFNRVNNAMPQVSKALLQFYPELTTQDLMAYSLDPVNQLPALQRKIQAAEIGGAALAQNLRTSLTPTTFTGEGAAPFTNVARGTIGVEAMQKAGATAETAARASAFVADVLQPAEKISAIYGDRLAQYGQQQAEQEAFLSSVEAKKRREALAAAERAAFQGEAGMLRSQRRAVGGLI